MVERVKISPRWQSRLLLPRSRAPRARISGIPSAATAEAQISLPTPTGKSPKGKGLYGDSSLSIQLADPQSHFALLPCASVTAALEDRIPGDQSQTFCMLPKI